MPLDIIEGFRILVEVAEGLSADTLRWLIFESASLCANGYAEDSPMYVEVWGLGPVAVEGSDGEPREGYD